MIQRRIQIFQAKNVAISCAILLMLLASCAKKVTTSGTKTSPSGAYSEDLSVWRPEPETIDTAKAMNEHPERSIEVNQKLEPKFAANDKLDPILDSISEVNLANGFIDGFTIQVYSGIKREEALNAKKELSTYIPDLESEIQYVQPNFRVRTGKYPGRIEAQEDYQKVRKFFPNAILIPDRIPIK